MDNSEQMLKQLKWIKWLLATMVLCMLVTAGAFSYFSLAMAEITEESINEASCNNVSFRDNATQLLDNGNAASVIQLTEERIKTHPADPDAYWYRGQAYYQQQQWQAAIADFDKTEELAPTWKDRHTDPYRTAAQAKLAGQH